ncbi:TRAP transporter large permease [Cytobacillus oceanisediminis]|uniref:Tripartite ATP-independent transporter DctM subunit n=1 Tax=Cytobacillus oceanisediminis TaxID=665099 RepID=A0A562J3U7_9BACI|nr:TRAP transporter large permease [Cytobacillus oceanisediminis]TWH77827.1 tripartite ATP-independent transporter DctM subunit [Cytobacillus oceanisediminis]
METIAGLILFASFFLLMFFGAPIAIAIILSSVITFLFVLPFDVAILTSAQRMVTGIDNFTMLAIPLFVLSGIIMNNGGIAFRLVNFAKVLVGKMPGALAHTNVVGNMLFGAIAGSSVASAAAMGRIMTPLQTNQGYKRTYSAAVNIASAPTGLIIPPSSVLIVYSLVSGGTSVAALFMAGYLPGILWGLAVMAVAYFMAKKENYPVSEIPKAKDVFYIIASAIPSLLLIVIVIGGIVAGIFTATEGAAVAVIYSALLSMFYKNIKIKDIPGIFKETIEITGMILFLITASALFSLVMSYMSLPEAISNTLLSITDNQVGIILIMIFILLLVGTFMDITPAVLIFTPIFLPISNSFGMDPVHFGMIICFALCIGNMTPPVGSALFVGCSVAEVRIEQVTKTLIPYFAAVILVLLLVAFIPQISLFLPYLFGL